ncbi:hypothetical protein [Pseudactinotalea terrae]|uniref:hypothetical protein n=1 Tax=Pseudactinotalea terrae TaxID=1743262 RepID=UPI0012E1B8BE|nr:hypothetical protein [Pseudactinotalea terrae]
MVRGPQASHGSIPDRGRVQAGVREGGQFAATLRAEAGVTLSSTSGRPANAPPREVADRWGTTSTDWINDPARLCVLLADEVYGRRTAYEALVPMTSSPIWMDDDLCVVDVDLTVEPNMRPAIEVTLPRRYKTRVTVTSDGARFDGEHDRLDPDDKVALGWWLAPVTRDLEIKADVMRRFGYFDPQEYQRLAG